MVRLSLAIFLQLSIFLSFPHAFGGEWHSAGNAPVMPHRPSGVTNLTCQLTGYATVGKKSYRFKIEKVVEDREFREPNWGAVSHTLENTGDPGMDGQSFTVGFRKDQNGEEHYTLNIVAQIKGLASTYSQFTAPRSGKVIRGVVDLNPAKAGHKNVSWVRVVAECREVE